MRRYLIASHGKMASGMLSTVKLLAGEREDIDYLDAYIESDSISNQIKRYFDQYKEYEILVFTDLLAGSVNREIMRYLNENTHIISGFNLPLLLELLLSDENITPEVIEEKLSMARGQMVYVNKLVKGDDAL
jgi:mannose/fructose-specific phosphotransferase system component IIA